MPGSGAEETVRGPNGFFPSHPPRPPSCSVSGAAEDDVGVSSEVGKAEKDPRKIARTYQLELCKKALEENVIVYLGTGSGKTHIAILLMYEMGHLIRKPSKNICVFLAPTVALVQQQARVIGDSIDFKVGSYCGGSKRLKTHAEWEKEIEKYEVLVMTPIILQRCLSHCFIKMDSIALLIFDECHHAQVKSGHPYAEIMRIFYKADLLKRPRIFGMTASPIVGKGASEQENLPRCINSLENLLNAKVYSVEDKEELDSFVASPTVKVYYYGPVVHGTSSSFVTRCWQLEEVKRQCLSTLSRKKDDLQILRSTKRMLNRMHDNIIICAESLGFWGATQACQILLRGDYSERNALIEEAENSSDVPLCDKYLTQAASIFASDCPKDDITSLEILKEPLFSSKLLCLVHVLSSFRSQPNAKCIVFVNRIVIARSLTYLLQNLTMLASWKCDYLVGVHSGQRSMSRKNMKGILDNFQSGKLNLLVATKVGEEGLDIQTCCLVIRFDPPETVASFIQSRGRARMPQSEYAFLVDRGNQKEIDLIDNFKKDEDRMNVEITARTSGESFSALEERIYRVDSSGASISSGSSISLLYQFCAKLPHDEYFDPKPKFYYFDDVGGTVCHIILPPNAPIYQIVSTPRISMEAAKKDASLQAIEELHKLGALDDFLLPHRDDDKLEEMLMSSDTDSCEDESSRGELHEMLVPRALRESWSGLERVALHSYYIEFCPDPADRTYKEFGLFVKECLPTEAGTMEIDLHLARGRSVKTKLVPSADVTFEKDEIVEGQKFQEMFLKVLLDRSDLQREFVPLGQGRHNDVNSSSSTYYLLLPVISQNSNSRISVDWNTIRRCLSSPLFGNPTDTTAKTDVSREFHLTLADGSKRQSDVENSLVYAPYKKLFYFITNINFEKRGCSQYKDSEPLTHAEHINRTYGIHLKFPKQYLLHAKPLFNVRNLLHNRKQDDSEAHELEEYLIDVPPELCQLKILGFSKDLGSSLSLLPSIMHRLQNLLVAIQLKHWLSASFSEGAKVTPNRILEALTTEKCQERFSLERLEILGDAFLKFAVGRHLFLRHEALDEGGLTRKRSKAVNNSNLFNLAVKSNLQVYIRDQPFEASQFFALGRPCPNICNSRSEGMIHSHHQNGAAPRSKAYEVRCSKGHHWLQKKTIADVIEALVGAFIVDSGFKAATAFLRWIGLEVDFDAWRVSSACIGSTRYLTLADCVDIDSLENYLGYKFHHRGLLLQAFVHPSYNKHGGGCYQRLEFLGDAVLDYLITSYLYSAYPKLKPGELTDLRSLAVNNKAFANAAVERSFHKFLLCDSSSLSEAIKDFVDFVKRSASLKGSLEGPKCPKALGDLVESCVGAILLDTGFDLNCVWKLMLSFLDPIMSFSNFQLNPKRELQELCQSCNLILRCSEVKKGVSYSVETKVLRKDEPLPEDELAKASVTNLNKQDAFRNSAQRVIEQLKAQGYTPKYKPLEEILKLSCKMEAKLIGYDEVPVDVMSFDVNGSENINMAPSNMNCSPKVYAINEASRSSSTSIIPLRKQPPLLSETASGSDASEISADTGCDNESQRKGVIPKGSAKSNLYEICAANCWKPPEFECCKEEGPGHVKLFWYKVVVAIEDSPGMVLECFSDPRATKKAAAEHAAEGALWYLRHEGYVHTNKVK